MIKKIKKVIMKMVYGTSYGLYLMTESSTGKEQKSLNKVAQKFIEFNNKRIIRKIREGDSIDSSRIIILLPHCLQNYNCAYRITTEIDNCKKCGICVIGDLKQLQEDYGINVKVATGGTLARKHIKDIRAKLVIAVACKRDLMSGVCDAFPIHVYGVFNEITEDPCINTTVSVEKIKEFLDKILNSGKIIGGKK